LTAVITVFNQERADFIDPKSLNMRAGEPAKTTNPDLQGIRVQLTGSSNNPQSDALHLQQE
jgi:hypothetical protein